MQDLITFTIRESELVALLARSSGEPNKVVGIEVAKNQVKAIKREQERRSVEALDEYAEVAKLEVLGYEEQEVRRRAWFAKFLVNSGLKRDDHP